MKRETNFLFDSLVVLVTDQLCVHAWSSVLHVPSSFGIPTIISQDFTTPAPVQNTSLDNF